MLSPGPANLVSFALGTRFGFTPILRFLLGISLIYIAVAIGLGIITTRLSDQYSGFADFVKFFGGIFILYLGFQLLRRKNRNASLKTPSIWNGVLLQLLNPKYPLVVLSVFSNSQAQNPLVTAGILSIVGVVGLVIYAAAGTFIHHHVNMESQLGRVDVIFGLLLCIIGLWLIAGQICIYAFQPAT